MSPKKKKLKHILYAVRTRDNGDRRWDFSSGGKSGFVPNTIDCRTDIEFRGPMAAKLAVLAQDGTWTKVSLDLLTKVVRTVKLSASGQTIGLFPHLRGPCRPEGCACTVCWEAGPRHLHLPDGQLLWQDLRFRGVDGAR
jgi:hypothetical protein